MTDKEELIKAVETLLKYCRNHKKELGLYCHMGCKFRMICSSLDSNKSYNVDFPKAMEILIVEIRCTDD